MTLDEILAANPRYAGATPPPGVEVVVNQHWKRADRHLVEDAKKNAALAMHAEKLAEALGDMLKTGTMFYERASEALDAYAQTKKAAEA